MTKILRPVLLVLAVCFLAAGCTGGGRTASGEARSAGGKVKVVTTIYPLYEFAKRVGGDRVEVYNLLPPGAEPHQWEPAPEDLVKISGADVFIYCGAGLESWVGDVLGSTGHEKTTVVDSSRGINLLEGNDGDQPEQGSGAGGETDSETGGVNARTDPHIWLDPVNAGKIVDNILEGLIAADPSGKDYYTANAGKCRAQLADLDSQYRTGLAGAKIKCFVVSHEAFGYLARRYGLVQLSVRGLSADSEPTPARMAEIVRLIKEYQIRCVFYETLVSPNVSDAIAREAGVKTLVLNPIEGLTEKEIAGGEDYFSVMRENLDNLKIACEAR